MAERDYQLQFGMELYYGDTAPADTQLAAIKEWGDLPGGETGDVDISSVDDDTAVFKEFVAEGKVDPGQLTLTLHTKISQLATIADLVGVSKYWKVAFRDGSDGQFAGYIKAYKPKANKGDECSCEVTVKVSGEVTWTPAA